MPESDSTAARADGPGEKRHDVFISYASPDKAAAEAVCAAMEGAGLRCWIAPRDTDAGAYSRSIIDGIRSARMLVLLLSPHSDRSPNVLSEVAEAFDRKVALLPFRLAAFEVSDDLRFFIRTHHWIDAFPGTVEAHLPRLVERATSRLAAEAAAPAPRPEAPSARPTARFTRSARPGRRRWRSAVIAAGAILLGVGGYFLYDGWETRRERERWAQARIQVNDAIVKARTAIEGGQFDEAFRQVDQATAIDPESVSLDDVRRALIEALRDRASAADRRRRALERVDRARDAIRRREFGVAQRHLDDAERLDPRATDYRVHRAGLPAYMRDSPVAEEQRRREMQEAARRKTEDEAKRKVEAETKREAEPRQRPAPKDEAQPKPPPPPPTGAPPGAPAAPARAPGTVFRDCAACPELVVLPAGTFAMGSPDGEREHENNESPQRQVTLAKSFALGKYDVTFAEFDACFADGGCAQRPSDGGWGRGNQPVVHVSWDDARAYLAWLSRKTGAAYRLPTEAEWEYAARAGTATRYFWGDDFSRGRANCAGCGSRWDGKQPAPVGQFAANGFGLYDMHGNVWQWVADCWHDSYRGAPADGAEWAVLGECARRGLRGGAFFSYPKSLRAAYRYAYEPKGRLGNIGFRALRELP